MGVPTSKVGYTSAMPRREDHEVRKGHVGLWIKKKNLLNHVVGLLNTNKNSIVSSLVEVTTAPATVCLLRMLSGMSSLSLLVVPWPQLELLLFCFLAGGHPSAGCLLSRLSRTGFAFLEDLLAEVDVAAAAAAAAVVVVVVATVVVATVFVAMEVVVVTVAAVAVLMPVVATADVEFTATVTGFASLLLDFRFLARKTTSGADTVVTFATDFST